MNKTNSNPVKMSIVVLFNFLVLSVPLYFLFYNEELFEFNKIILVYTITSLIVFFWLVRMVQQRKLIFKNTPLNIPILLFLISQLISTIFSIHPRTSMLGYYSRFNGGLLSLISYALLYYAFVSNIKKKDLSGILISMFTSGIIVSIYGILEHFGHSISCLMVPGEKSFGVSCWKPQVQLRVFATFGQPNWLAAYVITMIPLGLVLSIKKKFKLAHKTFFAISSILLVTVLIFTKSRSGMLGFATGIFSLLVGSFMIFFKNKKNLISKIDFKFTGILVALLIIIIGIFGTVFTPSFKELIIKNNQNQTGKTLINDNITSQPEINRLEIGGTDSGEIRKIVWKGGLQIWKRYPLIGSGVETFAYSYYLDKPREHNDVSEWDFLYNKAHNELINLLATSGILGLATYLSIFVTLGILSLKIVFSKKNESTKLISIAILAGVISLSISNFFGFSTVAINTLMFVLFGIFIILNQEENKKLKKGKSHNKKKYHKSQHINSVEQYAAITILSIFLIVILLKIYNYWEADKLFSQGKTQFLSGNLSLGIQKQIEAINKSPNEALYYDNLSDDYAKLAIELAKTGQTTASASIVNEAVKMSNLAMQHNDRHLNFYKTRSRMFITLAQLDKQFLVEAQNTLTKAMELSPMDPKLVYTQAVIEMSNGNIELGQQLLEKSLILKPNYEKARWKLSSVYESKNKINKAIEQLEYILNNISPENKNVENKILQLKML